jgi:hypothetical protein
VETALWDSIIAKEMKPFTRHATRILCGGPAEAARFTSTGLKGTEKFPEKIVNTLLSKHPVSYKF